MNILLRVTERWRERKTMNIIIIPRDHSWSSTFIAAIMDDDEIWVVFLVIIFVVRTLERLPA